MSYFCSIFHVYFFFFILCFLSFHYSPTVPSSYLFIFLHLFIYLSSILFFLSFFPFYSSSFVFCPFIFTHFCTQAICEKPVVPWQRHFNLFLAPFSAHPDVDEQPLFNLLSILRKNHSTKRRSETMSPFSIGRSNPSSVPAKNAPAKTASSCTQTRREHVQLSTYNTHTHTCTHIHAHTRTHVYAY